MQNTKVTAKHVKNNVFSLVKKESKLAFGFEKNNLNS
jgi:hypothetical protein